VGKDISPVLSAPEAAAPDALRPGALFNYNMLAYLDSDFLMQISEFIRGGGNPKELSTKGWRPDLRKRGAIRSVYDGRYKLNRYFSPEEHNTPGSLEALLADNDVELFDLAEDPYEMRNLALDRRGNGELLVAMNDKLNALIEAEVGEDIGQMLPDRESGDWALGPAVGRVNM
jgi:arylsulfatase